jgi:ParB-like chromosome segregation protein Spo0J
MTALELHELDLRYERLRPQHPEREKRLLASLAEHGQLAPVVVVASAEGRRVLIDGFKRVRCLRRLRQDELRATQWEMDEPEALVLERLLRRADGAGPLEEGWLLRELRDRFGLSLADLGRRFERTESWVSRRLALVSELPEEIQEQVRQGALAAYAAMKFLVPLARANRAGCVALAAAVAPLRPTTREVGALCAAYAVGTAQTRALLLADPALFLRAREEAARAAKQRDQDKSPAERLLGDLGLLGAVARRTLRRLRDGLARELLPPERAEVWHCAAQARADARELFGRCEKELGDARPVDADRDPAAA